MERQSEPSGARLTLSLSPSRTTAGQQDLEDAQQEVHGRGGAAVAAGLRASEPRHAGARAPLRCSPHSPLARWRPSCLAPGPPPCRPAPPRPAPCRPRRRRSCCSSSPGRAAWSERVCAADREGRNAAGCGGKWTMRTRRPRAPRPGAEHMAAGPPRSAHSAGPGRFPRLGRCRLELSAGTSGPLLPSAFS